MFCACSDSLYLFTVDWNLSASFLVHQNLLPFPPGASIPLGNGGTPPWVIEVSPRANVYSQTPRLEGLGTHRKLPQRGLERRLSDQRIWDYNGIRDGSRNLSGGSNPGPHLKVKGEARIEGSIFHEYRGRSRESRARSAIEMWAKLAPRAMPEKYSGGCEETVK